MARPRPAGRPGAAGPGRYCGKIANPCWEVPATLVKSPPISRKPAPPVRANTPSALFTLGAQDWSAPVVSSTARIFERAIGFVHVCCPPCGPQ